MNTRSQARSYPIATGRRSRTPGFSGRTESTLRRQPAVPARVESSPAALRPWPFFFLHVGLLLGNLLVLFNTGAFASISLHAAGALGVSPSHATWMQTYYFISLAAALPVGPWLSVRFGQVRVFLAGMSVLAVGSLLCLVTEDLASFLLGRVLQGFFGGLVLPLSQSLLLREYPAAGQSTAVALWSMAALTPFTLGPAAGGWLAEHVGWRSLFALNVPLALCSAALIWALLVERVPVSRVRPFDRVGFTLLAVALSCLQTVLNQGQDEDWFNSTWILLLAVAASLAFVSFVVWELDERHPLVELRLFLRRNFAIGTLTLSASFLLMYGLLSVLLVRLQSVSGYTSLLAGSALLPLVLLAKPVASAAHRIVHRYDARLLASGNLLAFAAYCYWTSRYDFFQRASLFTGPLWSQVLEGFCLGGLFVPLTAVFLSGLNPRRQVQAAELGSMLRVLGGSAASPLLGVLWERRAAFHQSRLVETLSPYEAAGREALSGLYAAGLQGPIAAVQLARRAGQHAAILGLDDAFRWAAAGFLALAALIWLADPVGPAQRRPTAKEAARATALEDLVEEP